MKIIFNLLLAALSIFAYSSAILIAYVSIHYVVATYSVLPYQTYVIDVTVFRLFLMLLIGTACHILFGTPAKIIFGNLENKK